MALRCTFPQSTADALGFILCPLALLRWPIYSSKPVPVTVHLLSLMKETLDRFVFSSVINIHLYCIIAIYMKYTSSLNKK